MMIQDIARHIPQEMYDESGLVFYSGRDAFASKKPLYTIGINPGPLHEKDAPQTVGAHTQQVLREKPADWSEYRDEPWDGKSPGTCRMQPRMLHLFRQLGLSAGQVPSSNLIFVRSANVKEISGQFEDLANLCWPVHAAAIRHISPSVILCLGGDVGAYVRRKLGANRLVCTFTERNHRKWKSKWFRSDDGQSVVTVAHPGRASWMNSKADPSPLVKDAIAGTR